LLLFLSLPFLPWFSRYLSKLNLYNLSVLIYIYITFVQNYLRVWGLRGDIGFYTRAHLNLETDPDKYDWCVTRKGGPREDEMRKDEHFSQMLDEMRLDEINFDFEHTQYKLYLLAKSCRISAVGEVADIDANNNKHDECMLLFSKEDLQSVVDAIRYPHESTSHLKEVSLSRTMLFASSSSSSSSSFFFLFSPMVL
jgi:hypothetical protein